MVFQIPECRVSVVQIEQDVAACAHKFSALLCRPIAAQFMANDLIALFEFEVGDAGAKPSAAPRVNARRRGQGVLSAGRTSGMVAA